MRRSLASLVVVAGVSCSAARGPVGGAPGGAAAPLAPCPTDRTLAISSQDDVTAYAACTTARGVSIRTGATVDTSKLKALETITGDLVIGPTVGIDTISFTELRVVEGAITVRGNASLHGVFLPRLERSGRITIDGNVSLTSLALPRLAEVGGPLAISDNHDLEVVMAGALAHVRGDISIENQPELSVLELDALASAGGIRFEQAPKLPADTAEKLRARIAAPAP